MITKAQWYQKYMYLFHHVYLFMLEYAQLNNICPLVMITFATKLYNRIFIILFNNNNNNNNNINNNNNNNNNTCDTPYE